MKMKMKNRSYRYDINRPSLDMDTNKVNIKSISLWRCLHVKQHLSDIWSSIHEQIKQHWDWAQRKHCLYIFWKRVLSRPHHFFNTCISVGTILLLAKMTEFCFISPVTYEGSRQEVQGVQKSDSKEKVRNMCIRIIHLVRTLNVLRISFLRIRTFTHEYQGARNVIFPENVAYVLNKWSHT